VVKARRRPPEETHGKVGMSCAELSSRSSTQALVDAHVEY